VLALIRGSKFIVPIIRHVIWSDRNAASAPRRPGRPVPAAPASPAPTAPTHNAVGSADVRRYG
jgi:hypothetical protein